MGSYTQTLPLCSNLQLWAQAAAFPEQKLGLIPPQCSWMQRGSDWYADHSTSELGEDESSAPSRVRRPLLVTVTAVMPQISRLPDHEAKQLSIICPIYPCGVFLPAQLHALLGWLLCKLTSFAGTESCSCLSVSTSQSHGRGRLGFSFPAVRFSFTPTAEEPLAAKAREPFLVLRSSFWVHLVF